MKDQITKLRRVYVIAGLILLQNCATTPQQQVQDQDQDQDTQEQGNANSQTNAQAQEMSFDNEGENLGNEGAVNDTSEDNFAWGNDQAVDQGAAVNSDASNEFDLASNTGTDNAATSDNELLQNPIALASTNATIPQNMSANPPVNTAMGAPQGDPMGASGDIVPAASTTAQTSYESVLSLPKCGI